MHTNTTETETVSIQDMMFCRDRRVQLQEQLLQSHAVPLISFCMNIPGPVKTDALIRRAFAQGTEEIAGVLAAHPDWQVLARHEIHEKTGDELMLAVSADAQSLKDSMSRIEESHPLGRLFDIDIIGTDGRKLSRPRYRTCLLCGCQAQECASSRRHSAAELFARIQEMLSDYFNCPVFSCQDEQHSSSH